MIYGHGSGVVILGDVFYSSCCQSLVLFFARHSRFVGYFVCEKQPLSGQPECPLNAGNRSSSQPARCLNLTARQDARIA